jgi:hypothetical protein
MLIFVQYHAARVAGERERDKYVVMSGAVNCNEFVQSTAESGMREMEIYFKVRSHKLPRGYMKYHLNCV